eukprot:COSAG02_NODE_34668_length_480_cov_1.081365_1_plen_105_part_10
MNVTLPFRRVGLLRGRSSISNMACGCSDGQQWPSHGAAGGACSAHGDERPLLGHRRRWIDERLLSNLQIKALGRIEQSSQLTTHIEQKVHVTLLALNLEANGAAC